MYYLCPCCEWYGDDPLDKAHRAASNAIEEPAPILVCPECGERVKENHSDYTKAEHDADAADMAHTSGE